MLLLTSSSRSRSEHVNNNVIVVRLCDGNDNYQGLDVDALKKPIKCPKKNNCNIKNRKI